MLRYHVSKYVELHSPMPPKNSQIYGQLTIDDTFNYIFMLVKIAAAIIGGILWQVEMCS